MSEKRDPVPPAAVIALRDLIAKWRKYAASQGAIYASGIWECADELDALLARVEPQEGTSNGFAGLPFKNQGFAGLPDQFYPNTLQSYRAAARVEPQEHSCEWKDAIIDACVVDWILTKEHETNPRRAVNELLWWQQRIALDPAVSEPAAKLHARITELEARVEPPPQELYDEMEGLLQDVAWHVGDPGDNVRAARALLEKLTAHRAPPSQEPTFSR